MNNGRKHAEREREVKFFRQNKRRKKSWAREGYKMRGKRDSKKKHFFRSSRGRNSDKVT